jgi:hypothetical protein
MGIRSWTIADTHLTPRGARQRGVFAWRGHHGSFADGGAGEAQPGRRQISDCAEGDLHCDGCVNFQAPNACKFVQGDISPNGWCQLFVAKPKS